MNAPFQDEANSVPDLAELRLRLAAKGIAIDSGHAYWSYFGCWEFQAHPTTDAVPTTDAPSNPSASIRQESLRLFWDGRDGVLYFDTPTCSPNAWQTEHAMSFAKFGDELLLYVEEYLTKRLRP